MSPKAMGLDLGTRTCGIAISDVLGIAHGREEYRFPEGDYENCLEHIIALSKKENIKEIALGYPLNMNGSVGDSAKRSEKFKEALLKKDPELKIELVDERLTTVQANKALLEGDLSRGKRKKVIDQQSAVLILESYLAKKGY